MQVEALIAGHLENYFETNRNLEDAPCFIGIMPDDQNSYNRLVSVYMTGSSPSIHSFRGNSASKVPDPDEPGITEVEANARRELLRKAQIKDRQASIHMPQVQIISRDVNYADSQQLAWNVYEELDGRTNWILGENDNETRIICIQSMQLPFPSGKDSQDRKLFSQNYQLWVDPNHEQSIN